VEELLSQLLNVHSVCDVRQIEMHMAEQSVPRPSPQKIKIAIATLKKHKLSGSDQISVELIQTEGKKCITVCDPQTH
jgi:hypothetical protein